MTQNMKKWKEFTENPLEISLSSFPTGGEYSFYKSLAKSRIWLLKKFMLF